MIKAHVSSDDNALSIRMAITRREEDDERELYLLHLGADGSFGAGCWELVPENVRAEPTLTLSDECGRALLDALIRHYGAQWPPPVIVNIGAEMTEENAAWLREQITGALRSLR